MEKYKDINAQALITDTLKRFETDFVFEENSPITSVKELTRVTGLYPDLVVRIIKSGQITFEDGDGSFYRASIEPGPDKPKTYDKIESKIQSEGQRYSRRSQFQSRDAKGRTLSRKVNSRIGRDKKIESKIILIKFDPKAEKEAKRQETKKRLEGRYMDREVEIARPNIISRAKTLKKLGIWESVEDRSMYSFRLSEDSLELSQNERCEMEEISKLMYMPGGYLDGGIKLFKDLDSLSPEIANLIINGMNQEEIDILLGADINLPAVSRLDLAMTKDGNPSFQIVEVEGDKVHAFGYSTITDEFRKKFDEREDTIGIVSTLKLELLRRGISPATPVVLIVGNGSGESFYSRELNAFSTIAQRQGLNLVTIPESNVQLNAFGIFVDDRGNQTTNIVNIPKLFTNEGEFSSLSDKLLKLYLEKRINVLIPPSRFLGGKGLLGLVSNGLENPELEETLMKYFDSDFLQKIRNYIPKTANISPAEVDEILDSDLTDVVIKKSMASGMKGVALPSDPKRQISFLEEARKGDEQFVIQKLVNQKIKSFSFVEPTNLKRINKANMYMRVSLFASRTGISTVSVTARQTPDVHGSRDSIQIPVIFGDSYDK